MSSRRRWLRNIAGIGLAALGVQQAWRHGHDYVLAEQFAVVEPGKVYRGAWQKDWPMRRIVRDRHIKTIVALAHRPDDPLTVGEKALADELGVRFVHVPIVDRRGLDDHEEVCDQLEVAAAAVADPANQPVFFHCHHGVNRASMVHMAYRMLYSGWTLDEAAAEVAESFGDVEVSKGPDFRHMVAFYRDRVLPRRSDQARVEPAEPTR